jgi:hypothetical protein
LELARNSTRTSFGDGQVAVARLLTITRTCELQQLNARVYPPPRFALIIGVKYVASLLSKSATP